MSSDVASPNSWSLPSEATIVFAATLRHNKQQSDFFRTPWYAPESEEATINLMQQQQKM